MKRRRERSPDIAPDLTSFGDIAFLLIIFFILTSSMARPLGRLMEMPSAATPPQGSVAPQIPSINLLHDRILYTEGEGAEREVTMNELRAALYGRRFATLDPKARLVVLETAEGVQYDRYFQAVTAIAETGGVVAMLSD